MQRISSDTAPHWFALLDLLATFTGLQSGDVATPRVIGARSSERGWQATIERFWKRDGSSGYHSERLNAELVPGIAWRYTRQLVDVHTERGLAYS